MSNQNTSDLIEAYLKKILEESSRIEIRRAEMAGLFDCVPSQISYVINTRLTVQRGYAVGSRHGRGGHVCIVKVRISDNGQLLKQMDQLIDATLTEEDALVFIQTLYGKGVATKKEDNLMLAILSKGTLNGLGNREDFLKTQIIRSFLERLGHGEE